MPEDLSLLVLLIPKTAILFQYVLKNCISCFGKFDCKEDLRCYLLMVTQYIPPTIYGPPYRSVSPGIPNLLPSATSMVLIMSPNGGSPVARRRILPCRSSTGDGTLCQTPTYQLAPIGQATTALLSFIASQCWVQSSHHAAEPSRFIQRPQDAQPSRFIQRPQDARAS